MNQVITSIKFDKLVSFYSNDKKINNDRKCTKKNRPQKPRKNTF